MKVDETKKAPEDKAPGLFNIEDAFIDIEGIEEGRWISLGADFPGVEILAVGLTSKPAVKYEEELKRTAPRSDRTGNNKLTTAATERITRKVVVQKCVKDWRGLGENGKPLPFSKDKLEYFINEPKARSFAIAIINAIVDLETRKMNAEETVKGN